MGTPQIISRIPGPTDAVLENETALVVPVKDSEALYSAMVKMTDNNLFLSMSQNCVEYIKSHFDSRLLNEKILERKKSLLEGK